MTLCPKTYRKPFGSGGMKQFEKIDIAHYVKINRNSELHLFVDACKSSYGVCVYIRAITPLGVKIRLIRARSRVALLKTLTIPRLELMACCIGAWLVHAVFAALDLPDLEIVAWCDSMVTLWWLRNHGIWSVFVANRVNEINRLVLSQLWRHVPGELNPADLLSRGRSPRLYSGSLWWEGPSWLLEPPSNRPINRLACETSEVEREKKEINNCFVSWMLRFVKNAKKKREFQKIGDLTVYEIEHAGKTLIKIVQAKFYPSEDSFPNMNVITDEEAARWERIVRVLKGLLRRTIGNAVLTTEELQRVLCDWKSKINFRPLTYLSENSVDLVPLSPAMFLLENRNLDVPDIDYRDTVNPRKRNKNKKGPLSELRLGEIVLIGDDIKKRMHWPLAKVIRLIPGKDGKIRTVELKTRTGTMLRPIQRVYPLEVQSTETLDDPLNDCTFTNPISSDMLSDPNDSSSVLARVSRHMDGSSRNQIN
ncbi:integrase catalytic domain-containing protein [Trichonephila clavipes]|nr:integrase catalytic domain-containing protein [Trichonephila clavipes]